MLLKLDRRRSLGRVKVQAGTDKFCNELDIIWAKDVMIGNGLLYCERSYFDPEFPYGDPLGMRGVFKPRWQTGNRRTITDKEWISKL